MDIGAWWATVHVVAKQSDTTERLSTHIHKMLQHISSNEKQTYRLKNTIADKEAEWQEISYIAREI